LYVFILTFVFVPICDWQALTEIISFLVVFSLLSTSSTGNKESYLAKIICSDVLGLLPLMLNTPLEHHFSKSKTTDSLMLAIKANTVDERSSPDSPNLNGKVNKTFAHIVVEMLAVNLLFD
jgi:hypothetical protein